MDLERFIKKERRLWHAHFVPSFIAGIVVAFIALVFEITIANVILFASVGASAVILTNSRSHHLTKLRTTIIAYVIAIIVSSAVYGINRYYPLHISINFFLIIFLVGIILFLADTFHPPAITAALSFTVLERPVVDLLYLFIAVIILLIVVRFATYTVSQRLSPKRFMDEFKRGL